MGNNYAPLIDKLIESPNPLERSVCLKRTNGKPLRPGFTKLSYPYPRLYDFMIGLQILARSGHVEDPRCGKALDLRESRFIAGAGWAVEILKRAGRL